MRSLILPESDFWKNHWAAPYIKVSSDIENRKIQYSVLMFQGKHSQKGRGIDSKDFFNKILKTKPQKIKSIKEILNPKELKFEETSDSIIETRTIPEINKYYDKEFDNIILNYSKCLRTEFYYNLGQFFHENINLFIKDILMHIIKSESFTYKTTIEKIKNFPENHPKIITKFEPKESKCQEFKKSFKIIFTDHVFQLKATFSFIAKNLNSNLKNISKIFEYLKTLTKSVRLVNNFREIKLKLKSLRLQKESHKIYKEIFYIFSHYKDKINEIEDCFYKIMKYNDLKIAKEQTDIENRISNGPDSIKRIMLVNNHQIDKIFSEIESLSLNSRFNFCIMIMDLAYELFNLEIILKKSSNLFKNFKLVEKSSSSMENELKFGGIFEKIYRDDDLQIIYNKQIFTTDLSLATQLFDKENYFFTLRDYLIEILELPTLPSFYDLENSQKFGLVKFPLKIGEQRFRICNEKKSKLFIQYIEIIENQESCHLLLKNTYIPFENTLKNIDKTTIPRFILIIVEGLIKLVSESVPLMACIDPSCLYISKNNKLKVLVKSPEEIQQDYKAPEITSRAFPGRFNTKSLVYSFGKIIENIYLIPVKGFSAKDKVKCELSENEKVLKELINRSTLKNLNDRPSILEIHRKLARIIK